MEDLKRATLYNAKLYFNYILDKLELLCSSWKQYFKDINNQRQHTRAVAEIDTV